jgi:hypothetical protein
VDGVGVLDGVGVALRLHRAAQVVVGLGRRDGLDPGQVCVPSWASSSATC